MPSVEAIDKQTRMLPESVAPNSPVRAEVVNGKLVHAFRSINSFGVEGYERVIIEAWVRLPQVLKKGPFGVPIPSWLGRYLPKRLKDVQLAIQPKRDLRTDYNSESTEELQNMLLAYSAQNPLIYEKPYVVIPHYPPQVEIGLRLLAPSNLSFIPFGFERLEKAEMVKDDQGQISQIWNSIRRGRKLTAVIQRDEASSEVLKPTYRQKIIDRQGLYQVIEGFWGFNWGGQGKPLETVLQDLIVREIILEDTTKKRRGKNRLFKSKLKFRDGFPRALVGTVYSTVAALINYEYIQPVNTNGTDSGEEKVENNQAVAEQVSKGGVTQTDPLFSFTVAFVYEDLKVKPKLEVKRVREYGNLV